jgi:hypothetical protein
LEGGPPGFRPRFTCAVLLRERLQEVADSVYGTIALYGARFHTLRLSAQLGNSCQAGHGLDQTPYNTGHATRGRLHMPGLG